MNKTRRPLGALVACTRLLPQSYRKAQHPQTCAGNHAKPLTETQPRPSHRRTPCHARVHDARKRPWPAIGVNSPAARKHRCRTALASVPRGDSVAKAVCFSHIASASTPAGHRSWNGLRFDAPRDCQAQAWRSSCRIGHRALVVGSRPQAGGREAFHLGDSELFASCFGLKPLGSSPLLTC